MVKNKIILTGNASYENKGCEAIIRGTVKIIDEALGSDTEYIAESWYHSEEVYKMQKASEIDKRIRHERIQSPGKRSLTEKFYPRTILNKISYELKLYGCFEDLTRKKQAHSSILNDLKDCDVALCAGGDNYSLDYLLPSLFTHTDDVILSFKKPCIIWGASVGPFSSMPKYEKYMSRHLKNVTAIFAREDKTVEYLESIGVKNNVYRISDPAFVMDTVKPSDYDSLPNINDSTGINLSPLMAKYWTNSDLKKWTAFSVKLVDKIQKMTKRPVYLIPHVVHNTENNDYTFLKEIKDNLNNEDVYLLKPDYTAEETKYIISNLCGFIGARTHATIAAFSTLVPTLSLAYSIKALGINKEVYGNLSYCLSKEKLNNVDEIANIFNGMLQDRKNIKQKMQDNMPEIKKNSYKAGLILKEILQSFN